jgi:hypothetical protein
MTRARDLAAGTFELATGGVLKLETSDTTVTDGSVLGKIEFKAPDEASGTDAILVGAAIEAVAEGTFAADNNATELVFKTGASAAADAKMVISSSGAVGIKTTTPATNGQFSVRGAIATTSYGNVSGDFSDASTGSLKISHASGVVKLITDQTLSLVTGTSVVAMGIDSTGEVTKPLQPAFHVVKNANQNNIATSTGVTVLWQVESYDVGGNFASNTFTAPVAGKYILTASIRVDSLDTTASLHNDMAIVTSNRTYKNIFDLRGLSADSTYWTFTINAVADMDAGDTAFVTFFQNGGNAQSDIKNDSTRTYFSGILVG